MKLLFCRYYAAKFFFVFILFNCCFLKAKNYSAYYRLINKAEEEFVLNKNTSCFKYYDQAFKDHTPFIKDPFIASQIALYLSDTIKFYAYLKICFANGMPLTSINASVLFKNKLTEASRQKVITLFNSAYKKRKVDSLLYNKICVACFQSDSIKLIMGQNEKQIQGFYKSENSTREFILENYLSKGIFINEFLLGITTDADHKAFLNLSGRKDSYQDFSLTNNSVPKELELRLKCPFNIIIHSHCFFNKNKKAFYNAMLNGTIHPKEYGILEEWVAIHYKKDDNTGEICDAPFQKTYYNIFGKDPFGRNRTFADSEEGIMEVEKNRELIFMQKFHIDKLKKEIQKQTQIIFFFDFADGYIY